MNHIKSLGVTTGPNNWYSTKNTCYGVGIDGTSAAQDNKASNWCYRQKGKPYNFNFFDINTRSKFYCSQLIYAAFLDNYGINLNTDWAGTPIHPLELADNDYSYLVYKKY